MKSDEHYITGLKYINIPIADSENGWNDVSYSWYYLKKNYNIDTSFRVDYSAVIPYKYTARGMYLQEAPYEQALLVSCTEGCINLIILDLRPDSPTYLRHNAFIIKKAVETSVSVYIPRGCAYGFVTLEDNTHITFKTDNYINKKFEKTYNLLDPYYSLRVPYPDSQGERVLLSDLLADGKLVMSVRDRTARWIFDSADDKPENTDNYDEMSE